MKELRIAVVGAGSIARNYHLPSLKSLAECGTPIRRVALCDLDEARAREMAARFGFPKTYTDYRAMTDAEAPDAVWVLVRMPAMREVVGYFLAQRVSVLLEKPPAENLAQARELAELALWHKTPNQVAFNRRYVPLVQKMKELLTETGNISSASCQFLRYNRREADFAYGTVIHGLDTLRYLGDSEVCEVHTRPGQRGSALITLAYASGATAVVEMLPQVGVNHEGYIAHAGDRTVMASWLDVYLGSLRCYDQGKQTAAIDNNTPPAPPEVRGGFYGESVGFITALLQGASPRPDLATSLRSVEIAEAVQRGEDMVFAS